MNVIIREDNLGLPREASILMGEPARERVRERERELTVYFEGAIKSVAVSGGSDKVDTPPPPCSFVHYPPIHRHQQPPCQYTFATHPLTPLSPPSPPLLNLPFHPLNPLHPFHPPRSTPPLPPSVPMVGGPSPCHGEFRRASRTRGRMALGQGPGHCNNNDSDNNRDRGSG